MNWLADGQDQGQGWIKKLPLAGRGWTAHRDMPAPASKTFQAQWQDMNKDKDKTS
jgi:L-lactate dehydrogenase complex protein LldF